MLGDHTPAVVFSLSLICRTAWSAISRVNQAPICLSFWAALSLARFRAGGDRGKGFWAGVASGTAAAVKLVMNLVTAERVVIHLAPAFTASSLII